MDSVGSHWSLPEEKGTHFSRARICSYVGHVVDASWISIHERRGRVTTLHASAECGEAEEQAKLEYRLSTLKKFTLSSTTSLLSRLSLSAGISEFATSPEKVSDYISPLLNFAAEHVPRAKHKETPLYILCTAGMRVLPER